MMTISFFEDLFVWDAHAGFELRCVDDLKALRIWKNSGVNFLSINVGYDANPWQKIIKALSHARDWLARTEGYRVVGTMHDIDEAVADNEMTVAFDIEGANALNGSVEMVRLYYDLGSVRCF